MEGYDTAEMPTAAAKILSLTFRRNNYYSNAIYASATDLTIDMSTGATAPSAWSSSSPTTRAPTRSRSSAPAAAPRPSTGPPTPTSTTASSRSPSTT
ncbi:MAG: hypothetical protein R3F30_03145 [Planctomycetota bacterium]